MLCHVIALALEQCDGITAAVRPILDQSLKFDNHTKLHVMRDH